MINVVGAGPAGSYFSYLCKKDCRLFEEHKEVGKPVACTGIMTGAIYDLVHLDKRVIVNELGRVRVVGKNKEITFKLKDKEVVVNRDMFDKFLVERAVDNGVQVKLNHKFIGCKNNIARFKVGNSVKKYKYEKLIGADGPHSLVARESGLMLQRKYWVGKQYSVKMKCNKDEFIVFFGDVPGFFGWVVPENEEIARVGVASERFSGKHFDALASKLGVKKERFIECQSGLIPQYDGGRASKGNVYLLGDAAGHVKATSVGFEEVILYEKDGFMRTKAIGELIDSYFNNHKNSIQHSDKPVQQEILAVSDINAYSPSVSASYLKSRNVKNLIRHMIDDTLYEILLEKGYRIKVTGSHSVMVLGNNTFVPKRVNELDKHRDKMMVVFDVPQPTKYVTEINLIEFIMRETPSLGKFVRIKGGRDILYSKSTEIDERYRSTYWGTDSIPLDKFLEKKLPLHEVGLSYATGKNIVIPNFIPVTAEFCRLLGYYAAEGSGGNGKITLTFGKKDKEKGILDDALFCITSVFHVPVNKIQTKFNPLTREVSAYSISFGGKLLSKIFSEVLGAGSCALHKGLPFIIFNVENNLKLEFLKGLLRGDGSIRIRKSGFRRNWSADISLKTVSKKLASDIVSLSFQLGLIPSLEESISQERILYGKKISSSKVFKITFSSHADLSKLLDIFPEKQQELTRHLSLLSGKKSTYGLPREILDKEVLPLIKKDLKQEFGNFYNYSSFGYSRITPIFEKHKHEHPKLQFLYNIVKNNLGIFSIKEIRKVQPAHKYVYDVEIPETQMFVGGIGNILLHNTGGGIVYGMRGGRCLARTLANDLDYEKEWRREYGRELWFHLMIRRFLNRLNGEDYDEMIGLLQRVDLGKYNRDYPFRSLGLLMHPGLLWFGMKHLILNPRR